jgi:hypothetical protein
MVGVGVVSLLSFMRGSKKVLGAFMMLIVVAAFSRCLRGQQGSNALGIRS